MVKQPRHQGKHLSPSFIDALWSLRTALWTDRILERTLSGVISAKMSQKLGSYALSVITN